MPDVVDGALGEIRAATGTAGGNASTTTPAYVQFFPGSEHMFLAARNFASSAVVVQVLLNPYLAVLYTQNNLETQPLDVSEVCQDNDIATVFDIGTMETLAEGDYILIGAKDQYRGVRVDMTATVNGALSVLLVEYWNGSTWVDISATDGTDSGGATFAVDGTVSWTITATVKSNWGNYSLNEIIERQPIGRATNAPFSFAQNDGDRNTKLHWTRWSVSVDLDSATIESMVAMNREANNYFELVTGGTLNQRFKRGLEGYGALEHRTDTGTGNLIVNVAARADGTLIVP